MSADTKHLAADPTPSSGRAAARVFDVTELLEQILPHVRPAESGQSACGLFTYQRVCKTFRDTITGSSQLQRQMFLLPVEAKTTSDLHRFSPVPWFVKNFLGASWVDCRLDSDISFKTRDIQTRDTNDMDENYTDMQQARDELVARRAHMPTVSWRSIKLGPLNYAKQIQICFEVFTGHCIDEDGEAHPSITWLFESDATLGDLFDRWFRLLQVLDKQVKRYNRLKRRRREEDQAEWEKDVDQLAKLSDKPLPFLDSSEEDSRV